MSALPNATYREDVADSLAEMENFARVLDDSKAYLNMAKRSLEWATGTARECDDLLKETDALIAKTKDAARKVRLATSGAR